MPLTEALPCASSRLPPGFVTVLWICNGTEPFETMEACSLRQLRKSQLHRPDGKTYEVLFAHRIDDKLVATCGELPTNS